VRIPLSSAILKGRDEPPDVQQQPKRSFDRC